MKAELPRVIILKMTGEEYHQLMNVLDICIQKTTLGGNIKTKIINAIQRAEAKMEEEEGS